MSDQERWSTPESEINERRIYLEDILHVDEHHSHYVIRGELLDLLDCHESGERHGFNVCRTGVCSEPCGPTGGCVQ